MNQVTLVIGLAIASSFWDVSVVNGAEPGPKRGQVQVVNPSSMENPSLVDGGARSRWDWDPLELRKYLARWKRELNDSLTRKPVANEHELVSSLLGLPARRPEFQPPPRAIAFMVKRGLDYRDWRSREAAVWGFGNALAAQPDQLIPMLRDGLNDSHPKVRLAAVECADHLVTALTFEPAFMGEGWSEEVKSKRGHYLDEIVDLLATKALLDSVELNADLALGTLVGGKLAPNARRLRSLDFALAGERIPFAELRDSAQFLRTRWDQKIRGIKPVKPKRDPADNPFG